MHSVDGRLSGAHIDAPTKEHLQAAVQWYLALNDVDVSCDQRMAWQRWLGADPGTQMPGRASKSSSSSCAV